MTSIPPSSQIPETTATQRVVSAVAAQEDVDSLDLNQPLYNAIDPDALDALFQYPETDMEVTFTYLGYEVTARSDDTIKVTPADG